MSAFFNRYSRWDGTQQINDISADEIMRALSDDLLNEGDLDLAMRRLFRYGFENEHGDKFPGLQNLLEKLRQSRQEQLKRYDMGSIIEGIAEKLEAILQTERDAIDKRIADRAEQQPEGTDPEETAALQKMLEQVAERKKGQLDALPADPAGQIRGLQEYEFMSSQAAADFKDLLGQLQQQVLEQTFEGMQQSLQEMTPEDLAEMSQMMGELNDMLERRARGEDPGFQEFMHRWGHYFGPDIENIDQLIERMQQRQGAMQQMLNSMSPEQRQQLQSSMQAALQNQGLQDQMQRLSENLGQFGEPEWRRGQQFRGDEQLSLSEAMRLLDRIDETEKLERQIKDVRDWRDLEDIDNDQLKRLLGDETAEQFQQLEQLARTLEDAGLISKKRGGYELTPQGMRKIGAKALEDIFVNLKRDRIGQHELVQSGRAGERIDTTKPYEFGDPFLLDLPRTVMNAVQRQGAGSPVRIQPDDFEVYRTELITRSSTVIMVDMSRSMFTQGFFVSARKVTLALESLIRSRYPRDDLSILGFSLVAQQLKPIDLPTLDWNEYQYGTNMHHGFEMARRILSRQKSSNKQILMITDGEPTAHMENGQPYFNYPTVPRTLSETLREVVRCTKEGITINTFMLDQSPALISFIDQLTKINGGRVFHANPDRLGEYVLVDYVTHKQKWIG